MGVAYFVIFASGIFALFGTFIAPVVLGGNDIKWPEDGESQFNLLLSALVTAVGFGWVTSLDLRNQENYQSLVMRLC